MLVIDDDEIVKVHIHTNHPGFVLEEAIKLGEVINLKIDNMKHQTSLLLTEVMNRLRKMPKLKQRKLRRRKRLKSLKKLLNRKHLLN